MCGICGIIEYSESVKLDKLQKMIKSINHRGPNSNDYFINNLNNIALGSTRLSILDLTDNGKMPLTFENTIIHNGEVYNYLELKEKFNIQTNSNTDTEVLLKLYNNLGKKCLDYLNGIYAFAIYDKEKNEIFCARDRLGVKPLFYYKDNKKFIFASEIKALLSYGIKAEPNNKIIAQYLKYGVYDHSNETFFKNIYQLPAAHYMFIKNNDVKIERYWDLEYNENKASLDNIIGKFRDLLDNSIKLQLRSDVPISLNLSGGIDSTLMSYTVNNINNGQKNFNARTYIFNELNDEEKSTKELINSLKWNNDFTILKSHDIPNMINELIVSQEQPFPGIITFAKHKLIKSIEDNREKVILEGQGGDEIAAGYQYIFGSFIKDLIEKDENIDNEIEKFAKINNISFKKAKLKVESGMKAIDSYGWSADCTNFLKPQCFNKKFIEKYDVKPVFPKKFKSNVLNFQYRDLFYTKLPRILRSCDRASMYHSKELRVPLLDHKLLEFCFNIPSKLKIKNGEQRYFYREAFKKIVPEEILRKPKNAVVDPQTKWLTNELKDWVTEIITSNTFKSRDIFNEEVIKKEYNNFVKNKGNNSFFIWQCINLEFWYRNFID